jgi:beta-lactam-binding protein with PASTA domain
MRDFFWRIRESLGKANQRDSPETRSLKLNVFLFMGIIGLMLIIGFLTFSIAVRGEDQNLVPNLKGKELLSALQDLKDKGLYGSVQAQFSNTIPKYTVIDQNPTPGTLVKAGKEVALRVSKGPVIDAVDNYIGRKLEDVRSELQTLFSTNAPNLLIKDPPIYQPSTEQAGTIIAQTPKAGTRISGVTYIQFVVSQPEGAAVKEVGSFVGMSFQEAINILARDSIPFIFNVRKPASGQGKGAVISQNPAPKSTLLFGQLVQLTMTIPPTTGDDMIFGLFKYSLPEYPIMVDVRLDVVTESGTINLLSMKHPGGPLAVPYIVPDGSEIVLSVLDKEEVRVRATEFQQ